MARRQSLLLVAALLALFSMPVLAWALLDGEKVAQKTVRADKIAKSLQGKAFSMSAAVEAAEKSAGGKAIGAKVEVENGKAIVEVRVVKMGDSSQLLVLDVDGETNKIIETEDEDDDDDEDDED